MTDTKGPAGADAKALAAEWQRRAHALGHDLRNPIGSVLGYVDLLRDLTAESLGDEERSFLERIEENCKEMLRELAAFTAWSDALTDEDDPGTGGNPS